MRAINTSIKGFLSSSLYIVLVSTVAAQDAGQVTAVQKYYDYLSNPTSKELRAELEKVMADDWVSIGDYIEEDDADRDDFFSVAKDTAKAVPDMSWRIEETLVDGDRVIVRGRVTGTPKSPFYGMKTNGGSFDIMSIDIHTIENNQITKTYSVEDWLGAIMQLE